MPHPRRTILGISRVDLRHEVFVAGKDDDDQQIGDHHDIDQGQNADDDVATVGGQCSGGEADEFLDELDQKNADCQDQAEVEGGEQPTTVEYQGFERVFY